ncbi:peptidase U35 family protein [Agrobacterium rubi TR3 = NBRC 13261]|uniref:Peptidase U35 family protein n=1 Tax=Agrobacterium rubi TR3 = NBRC 13261 TaxID=1368415 RepID=A0A081CWY9_9HYPH|nr:prohead protease/major capsid protein fusion protein [Agrobacterium rubi]MBP1878152.1 phage head maturation protease [Agrobacterium rubi]GAK71185.1 peptidase U35 family protein [Agrobacterium rubi TR3 = NBRC 13261]
MTLVTRAASVSTLNEADRTVEVCWSTGVGVKRYSYDEGYYMEELQVDANSIRMDRFEAMSLLDSHDNYSMDSVLGSVVPGTVRIGGGKAYARIKFSKKQRAEELFQDVRDGHKLAISVGYKIHRYEKTEGADGQLPVLRAVDWEPMELSAVPIPADAGAFSRSEKEPSMTTATAEQTRAVATAERRRIREIEALATTANIKVDDELVRKAVDDETTVDQFRSQLVDAMIANQNKAPTFPIVETRDMDGGNGNRRQAMADALQTRINPSHTPKADARQYCNLSLIELAREVLQGDGVNVRGLSKGEIAERALHTTSDFAIVLAETGKALLQKSYDAEPSGIKRVARASTIDDFRPKRSVRLSDWPDLKKVNEHGEFTRGTVYESEESYRLQTYGRVIGFTRQLLINDSLGAFTEPSKQFGRSAARLEADILADLVVSNPKMGDGKALFHHDHKNILPAAALSVESVAAARTAIRKQVDDQGKPASLRAKFLIVPPDLEMEGEKILAAIAAARTEDVNVNAGRLELVVEDRLVDPKAWFLAVDPESVESLEYSYLTGEPGPQFAERPGFDVDGVEYKCRLDFGAGFLGWRGWYRSAGV